jgi:hypothetical protein
MTGGTSTPSYRNRDPGLHLQIIEHGKDPTVFPPFTIAKQSILHQLLTKDGSQKVTALLQDDGILPHSVKYLSHGEAGAPEAKKGKKAYKKKVQHPCHGSDCHKTANVYLKDGTSTGYCFTCAAQYAPVSLSEKKSARECSVDGCSYVYTVTVGD